MASFRRVSWILVAGLLTAAPARAAESAQFFPPDTQAVITIDFKQILGSPLFKDDLPKIQDALKGSGEAQAILKALEFDPLKDLDSITFSAVGAAEHNKAIGVIKGKFNVAKFKAHAQEVAKNMADHLKIHTADGQTIYEATVPNSPEPLFLGLLDDSTIVGSPKKEMVVEAFAIKAGKKTVALKKEITALLDKAAAAKRSISFVALGGALPNEFEYAKQINFINGGFTFSNTIVADIAIDTKDADSAKGLKSMIEMGLDQAKSLVSLFAMQMKELAPVSEILEVLKVSDQDKTVSIKGEVSKETLEKLNKMK